MKTDHPIKKLLKAIVDDSETLRLLKTSPEKLAAKTGLSKEDIEALKGAEIIVSMMRKEYTFTAGLTITA
jgi:hypothetical protein